MVGLELPATGWTRKYRVRAFGHIDEASLTKLEKGVDFDSNVKTMRTNACLYAKKNGMKVRTAIVDDGAGIDPLRRRDGARSGEAARRADMIVGRGQPRGAGIDPGGQLCSVRGVFVL